MKRARLCFDTKVPKGWHIAAGKQSCLWVLGYSIIASQCWAKRCSHVLVPEVPRGWGTVEELTWGAKPNEAIKAFEGFRRQSSPLPAQGDVLQTIPGSCPAVLTSREWLRPCDVPRSGMALLGEH